MRPASLVALALLVGLPACTSVDRPADVPTTTARKVLRPLALRVLADVEQGPEVELGGPSGTTDLYAAFGPLPGRIVRADLVLDAAPGAEPVEVELFAAVIVSGFPDVGTATLGRRLDLGRRRLIAGAPLRLDVTSLVAGEAKDGRIALVARGDKGARVVAESLRLDVYVHARD